MALSKQAFSDCAAKIAARLPSFLVQEFTLGVTCFGSWTLGEKLGDWYSNNGYFKFEEGQKLD